MEMCLRGLQYRRAIAGLGEVLVLGGRGLQLAGYPSQHGQHGGQYYRGQHYGGQYDQYYHSTSQGETLIPITLLFMILFAATLIFSPA